MGVPNSAGGSGGGSLQLFVTPKTATVVPTGTQQFSATGGSPPSLQVSPKTSTVAPSGTLMLTASG